MSEEDKAKYKQVFTQVDRQGLGYLTSTLIFFFIYLFIYFLMFFKKKKKMKQL